MDCLFCKIVEGSIPADVLFEDDELMVFKDINPKAKHHVLIIPKKHIATLNDTQTEDQALLGTLMLKAKAIAEELGIAESGYRVVMNCNDDGGQEVYHIHLHCMGGEKL